MILLILGKSVSRISRLSFIMFFICVSYSSRFSFILFSSLFWESLSYKEAFFVKGKRVSSCFLGVEVESFRLVMSGIGVKAILLNFALNCSFFLAWFCLTKSYKSSGLSSSRYASSTTSSLSSCYQGFLNWMSFCVDLILNFTSEGVDIDWNFIYDVL